MPLKATWSQRTSRYYGDGDRIKDAGTGEQLRNLADTRRITGKTESNAVNRLDFGVASADGGFCQPYVDT